VDSGEGGTRAQAAQGTDAPTRELPAVPAAPSEDRSEDRCSACGVPLAHDQRYCVECGERRGQSTLPLAEPAPETRSRRTRRARVPRQPRVSPGATLVAGVGVLLLANGLGVLIGRLGNNNATTTRASSPALQVITVPGAGSGSSSGAAAAATTPTTVHVTKKEQAKLKAAAAATAPPPPAVQKKATQAAGKVLGNSNNLPPPTVTQGQSCNGAGCQNGHFNGNFFGP
jgi:hypothetical protein